MNQSMPQFMEEGAQLVGIFFCDCRIDDDAMSMGSVPASGFHHRLILKIDRYLEFFGNSLCNFLHGFRIDGYRFPLIIQFFDRTDLTGIGLGYIKNTSDGVP